MTVVGDLLTCLQNLICSCLFLSSGYGRGFECDAVVHLRNGSYGLIEIKLGGDNLINDGVATLKSLEGRIDTDRMKLPSFLMVLTAVGSYAYRREDGVFVVPIGCLRD